ncbi:hypothetical protein BT96DRAFT_864866 [Gymnopus androsaceus JB14]|uniref:Uncharacterized protein n=1 Tax=Gymnopus androsaceus JB14 TaxID=1447944 RepID=A0A6A4H1M0_9AGAR|nr:hypothetical protein BT96DRAFT_864866 [Gymnopus androsaceus JB14]
MARHESDSGTTLCSKCRNSFMLKPRVNVSSANLDGLSNHPPSPHDIHELILLSQKDLDDYDTEIARLQTQIDSVQEQKKSLNDYKTNLQSLLSPFRELPNEIMCLIFELACTDNLLQQYPWPVGRNTKPPTKLSLPAITYLPALSISAVCTRWRFLALASPRIWSQIRVETAPEGEVMSDRESGFLSTLQLYLDRSADSPLLIDLQTPRNEVEDERNPSALSLLLNYTSRWQIFSYTGDFNLDACEGFHQHHSFPILEALNLRGVGAEIQTTDLDCFEHAPKLRAVRTDYLETDSDLPWTQLTSLDVGAYEGWDINLLHHCHGLTVLKLRDFWPTLGTSNTSLTRLKSFTFTRSGDERTLEDMFSCFTFPSLKELFIYPEDDPCTRIDNWPLNAFIAFISRSSCALTMLSLNNVAISDLDLIATLHLLPSLTLLSIDDLIDGEYENPITSHFISSMHASSAAPLLPKLHSLSIKLLENRSSDPDDDDSLDDATFIDMVLSRWIPDRTHAAAIGIDCLRSLVLHFWHREIDEDIYRGVI